MARKHRLGPAGFAQHVIQRGNNRSICFADESDYIAYAHWLKKFSLQFDVAIHAWVLMTNHVHLLCTPNSDNRGVSAMMQSLGRMYVRYFNHKYNRTGTLWEGRFNSSLVSSEEYKWSSYRINALGIKSMLCSPHPVYLSLGKTDFRRLKAYRTLFKNDVPQSVIDKIQTSSRKELALGSKKFKHHIEQLTGSTLKNETLGRPASNNRIAKT